MSLPALGAQVPTRGNGCTRWLGRYCLQLCGWKVGGEIPNLPKFLIIAAPHTSNWDFPLGIAAMYAIGFRIYWMGKHSLFHWPMGVIMRWLGGIPIDRRAPQGMVEQMVGQIHAHDQIILAIPPEGTRKKVERWKSGFYRIAEQAGIPILLAKLDYANKTVTIGPLFHPSGDLDADMQQIMAQYDASMARYPDKF